MLLAIDIGNTNIVFAVFDGDNIVENWRMSTNTVRSDDEYIAILSMMLKNSGLNPKQIDNIIISNVVPQILPTFTILCSKLFNIEAKIVDHTNINIPIKLDSPSEVGADRLVNAVSAYKKYQQSAIIIDFGTATTFDVVGDDGAYLGGAIAPGINLSLRALHQATAKLPNIKINKPNKVIGKSTISAIESGIYFGYIGLIEGLICRIKQEHSNIDIVIATGGLASLFIDATDVIDYLEEDLTLYGLKYLHELA